MWLVALCCAAGSGWLLTAPSADARQRLDSDEEAPSARRTRANPFVESAGPRACLCLLTVAFLGWLLLGTAGALFGALAGVFLSVWIGRIEPPAVTRARAEIGRDLPLAVDLLAACALAGRSPSESLPVVASAVGGALGVRFDEITARLALGADPVTEWGRLAHDGQLAELGRTMLRSVESGAPLVDGLTRLAEDRRRERRTHSLVRARNVGIKAAGPLAICFLPAFMLVGVVPTVTGSFQHLLG